MDQVGRLLLILLFPSWAMAAPAPSCGKVFDVVPIAKLVKTRNSGARIFRVETGPGRVDFYKEREAKASYKDQVFNDDRMGVLAYNLFESFKLNQYIARTMNQPDGMTLELDGRLVTVKAGILQEGRNDVLTVFDGGRSDAFADSSAQLQPRLNSSEWQNSYADWKAIWILLQQVDLNIANMGVSKGKVFVFDSGDAFNRPEARCRFGICNDLQNLDFNFPNRSHDRVHHRPDFRKTSEDLKVMIRSMATMSAKEVGRRLGPEADALLGEPRASREETGRAIRNAARWLASQLDRAPY